MSLQQVVQPRSSTNGFGRRKVDREMGTRLESTAQSGKSSSNNSTNAGFVNGGKVGGFESTSRDRLIYIATCLIGHPVEVHVKNGSVLSGIFHATNAENDFGIVLKMARVMKDGSHRGQKPVNGTFKRPHTVIIPARDLVQLIAKDVSLTSDEFFNGHGQEKRQDIMLDSVISQSYHVEVERELERWTPDKDDPQYPELENIFDGTWNRKWDQFETNEALFGVKSTFDEDLYTTKLERGPQMRELEIKASRIAREIEGEDTLDLHLAEERGIHLLEDFDYDEESRFSSVHRMVDNGTYEGNDNTVLDSCNTETFGRSFSPVTNMSFSDVSQRRNIEEAQASSSYLSLDEEASSQILTSRDMHHSDSAEQARQLTSDRVSKNYTQLDDDSRTNGNHIRDQDEGKKFVNSYMERPVCEDDQPSKFEEREPSPNAKKASFNKGGLSPNATAYAPSSCLQEGKDSINESSEPAGPCKASAPTYDVNPQARPGSSTSSPSERIGAESIPNGRGLSPSSSVGSLTSEKSTLNPYAKEFKFNPNAKSFTPSASLRPHSPVSEGSFYYATNMSAVPHMHGLPVGIGVGSSFAGHQPVVYSPQAVQIPSPHGYAHPNGPVYGQHMIIGQPRPVLYMPSYPPEMPYKGREF